VTEKALASLDSTFEGSPDDATVELERLLDDAVRVRLEADVPLGAFLSGGIDSSTIVALMQRHVPRPVRTFTVGFDEAQYNEAEDAKKVAIHLGTDHTDLYVSPGEAMAVIPQLPTLYDEPFADSSQIPTFLISQLARRHVTVSLSGDGGDEMLAGYNRYRLGSKLARRVLRSPRFVREVLGRALRAVAPATWDRVLGALGTLVPADLAQRRIGNKLHRFAGVLTNGQSQDAYTSFMSVWDRPRSVVLGTTDLAEWTAGLSPSATHLDETQRMMLLDPRTLSGSPRR
jgi:asparagine synthase (glutamine-hydrolysing)